MQINKATPSSTATVPALKLRIIRASLPKCGTDSAILHCMQRKAATNFLALNKIWHNILDFAPNSSTISDLERVLCDCETIFRANTESRCYPSCNSVRSLSRYISAACFSKSKNSKWFCGFLYRRRVLQKLYFVDLQHLFNAKNVL